MQRLPSVSNSFKNIMLESIMNGNLPCVTLDKTGKNVYTWYAYRSRNIWQWIYIARVNYSTGVAVEQISHDEC